MRLLGKNGINRVSHETILYRSVRNGPNNGVGRAARQSTEINAPASIIGTEQSAFKSACAAYESSRPGEVSGMNTQKTNAATVAIPANT